MQRSCRNHGDLSICASHQRRDGGLRPPGETRTTTREAVAFLGGGLTVKRCPRMNVDQEIDFICDKTKVCSPLPWFLSLRATPTGEYPDSATKPVCDRQLAAPAADGMLPSV